MSKDELDPFRRCSDVEAVRSTYFPQSIEPLIAFIKEFPGELSNVVMFVVKVGGRSQ